MAAKQSSLSGSVSKGEGVYGYKGLIELGKEMKQRRESELIEASEAEQNFVSYFDEEENRFIKARPFRDGARPEDDDYSPLRSTEVFDRYYEKPHTYNPSYPITSCFKSIVDTIESSQVTVIEGATGVCVDSCMHVARLRVNEIALPVRNSSNNFVPVNAQTDARSAQDSRFAASHA